MNITQDGLEECTNLVLQSMNAGDVEKKKGYILLMLKKLNEMIPDDVASKESGDKC